MLLLMTVGGANDTTASPNRSGHPQLTIPLDSHVPIAPGDLPHVTMDVMRIFGAIGVIAECVCEGPASSPTAWSARRPSAGLAIQAVIVAGPPAPPAVDARFLGMTPPGDSRCEIVLFREPIEELAQRQHRSTASIAALVLAHEIGHVLLLPPAHATVGIMQAPWVRQALDHADAHELLFPARQGVLIRQRLDQCCATLATRAR
jgi:hypothetical protein